MRKMHHTFWEKATFSLVFTCAHCSICYHYIIFWKKSYRNGNGLQQQQCIEKKVGNPVEYYWHYNMSIQLSLLPREQLHSISQIVNAHLRLVSRIARQFGNVRCFPMQKLLKSLFYAMYGLVWRLCWCSKQVLVLLRSFESYGYYLGKV